MAAAKRKRAVEDDGEARSKLKPSARQPTKMTVVREKSVESDEEHDEEIGDIDEEEGEEDSDGEEDEDDDQDDEFTSKPHSGPIPPPDSSQPNRRPMTSQEMTQLRDASLLYQSASFALSTEAFLPTLRPPSSSTKIAALTAFLHTLRAKLLALPEIAPIHPAEAERLSQLDGVKIPYPLPRPGKEVNWKVRFIPPTDIQVLGSWATGTALSIPGRARLSSIKSSDLEKSSGEPSVHERKKGGKEWTIDLGVTLPEEMWEKKDYLNNRVWGKRAFYLAVLAAGVVEDDHIKGTFESAGGDEKLTRLVLRAKAGPNPPFSPHFAIHIHPLLPSGSKFPFPTSHLTPSRSSLHISAPSASSTALPSLATPLYNSHTLSLSQPLPLLLLIHRFTQDIPAFRDALALLRAWASRRGFDRSHRPGERTVLGFEERGVFWALLVGGCVQGWEAVGPRIPGQGKTTLARGMSSYQLFRGVLDFLRGWKGERALLMKRPAGSSKSSMTKEAMKEWTEHHEVVFLEPEGLVNVLADVPKASVKLLAHEAALALQILDSPSATAASSSSSTSAYEESAFDPLFLRDLQNPLTRFDAVLRIDLSGALPIADLRAKQLDCGSIHNALLQEMQRVVVQALGTRVKHAVLLQTPVPAWEVSVPRPQPDLTVHLGLLFQPGEFSRLVDHGSPASDTEGSAAFRAFWGDRAELRRFKDGTIEECVVWPAASMEDRANIPSRMVQYILGRHFRISESAVELYQPMLDQFLQLPESAVSAITGSSSEEAGWRIAQQVYDQLVKQLKGMDDFPLSLLNVSALSEGLRYTSIFPPLPMDLARAASLPDCLRHMPAIEIVLEFEASTKWPDDLQADQKIKLAFFEEIARSLEQSLSGAIVNVVLDPPPVLSIEDNCLLEVIMPQGVAFHARIYHNRERTLLERLITDRETSDAERKQATGALERFHRRFVQQPRHHAAVATLHHKYAAYSQTVRLTKRWLAAHLLFPHVPPELVELLCANLFLSPGLYGPPGSVCTGFLRVLYLLSTWKYVHEPLLVPLYTSKDAESTDRVHFPTELRTVALEAFATARSTDPGVGSRAWFIATEEDVHGLTWGRDAPSALICRRITQLAKTCYQYVEEAFEVNSLQVGTLFNPPYDDYDFILQLDLAVLPRVYQSLQPDPEMWQSRMRFRNLPSQEGSVYGPEIKADLDPTELFFRDLQRIYNDNCIFFYDPFGGSKIAAIWNPSVIKHSPFKVLLGFSSKPDPAHPEAATNGEGKGKGKPMVALNTEGVLNEIAVLGSGLVQSVTTK